jgi:hypothetical protein
MKVRVGSVRAAAAVLLLFTASVPGEVAAQVPEPDVSGIFDDGPTPPLHVWGTYGLGTAFVSDGGDPQDAAHLARLTLERGANSLILHFARVGQAFGPASDEVHEVGALYGRALNRGLWKVQGAIGLARLAGFECLDVEDPEDCDATGTFGFPASLEFTVRPLPFLGVGAHAFATVSPDGAWGGIGLVGHLGLLR